MESCSKRIDKIKYTIDEIKDDIQKMKTRNKKTLNSMMNSINLTPELKEKFNSLDEEENQMKTISNRTYSDEEKQHIYRKYESYGSSQGEFSPRSVSSQNSYIYEQNGSNDNIIIEKNRQLKKNDNYNENNQDEVNQSKMLIKYKNEVEELKETINALKKEQSVLKEELIEQQRKKENLLRKEKEINEDNREFVKSLGGIINCSSPEETLSKINEMYSYLNSNECIVKHEFIDKLKNLYFTLGGCDSNKKPNGIEMQILWKWINYLVQTLQNLSHEKEHILKDFKQLQQNDKEYKLYFKELIKEFNLDTIEDLKVFINELLNLNALNRKRVKKLKKVLLNDNNIKFDNERINQFELNDNYNMD